MCKTSTPKMPKIPEPKLAKIAATDNREAHRQSDIEARLRRLRSGAAANVLTSPTGIPVSDKLGEVA